MRKSSQELYLDFKVIEDVAFRQYILEGVQIKTNELLRAIELYIMIIFIIDFKFPSYFSKTGTFVQNYWLNNPCSVPRVARKLYMELEESIKD